MSSAGAKDKETTRGESPKPGYRRLIRYVLRQWRPLLVTIGLTIAYSVFAVVKPWPLKLLIDHALGSSATPATLRSLLGGLSLSPTPIVLVVAAALVSLAIFVVDGAMDVGLSLSCTAASQRMLYDLSADVFHRLQRLSISFHRRRGVGDSLVRVTEDPWCSYCAAEGLLIAPLRQLLTLAAVGAVAWRLDPGLATLSLAMAPVLGASALYFGAHVTRGARVYREAQSRLLSFVLQTITAIPVVQAFGTEGRNQSQYRQLAENSVALSQRGLLIQSAFGLVNGLTLTIGSASVLYFGGRRVLSGELSVGSLVVFIAYLQSMQNAWQALLNNYTSLRWVQASIERVLEVFEADEEVRDAPGARPLPPRPPGQGGHVVLEDITFGYEAGRPVLHGVSLEARPGESLALVGPTGAGKSTLVSMIPRFFDPWEGRVSVDGLDLREVRLSSARARVALVLQEPFLLPLTVAENIAYGRPGAGEAEIRAAAVAANADEFIRRLPQGYHTVLAEGGASLSGGEKQRLSIARALLKDAPILILDEPTSAVDAQTEALFLEALERLMEGRTTFIIAHRLSTIRRVDRILVLENGRVVEQGAHRELLANGGVYHRFHSLQFRDSAQGVVA